MDISEKLTTVQRLKKEIEAHGKLPDAVLNKINYKFRLDWNYYSSSMEGNSLTMQETRSIMIGNVTIGGKPLKDVLEMKGHDEVVHNILKIGKGELNLSEKRIRDIHKAIMNEEDKEKQKEIGEWKKEPNEVINYKEEKFGFTPPAEVQEEMHTLLNWLNAETEKIRRNTKDAPDPALLAFDFHLRYLTIHPFYDGNGRTARILTNLILISFGFPPVIIKGGTEKQMYYRYLADVQAYNAPKDFYYGFMLDLLVRSEDLILKAIKGEEIEDPDDLDKKLAMLEMELNAVDEDESVKWRFSQETFFKMYDLWISELIKQTVPAIQKFNKFFTGIQHTISGSNGIVYITFIDESPMEVELKANAEFLKNKDQIRDFDCWIRISTFYGTLIKGGLKSFGCNYSIIIRLETIKYTVEVEEFVPEQNGERKTVQMLTKLLHKPLTDSEIKAVVKKLTDSIYQHIEFNIKKAGLR